MFDIGWGELLVIGVVALLVIGPKELPGALRTLGQWMSKLRRMASEFQGQFHEAMREAEMADLKKQVDEMTSQAQSYANFDPVSEVRKEFESTQQQVESAITSDTPPLDATPSVPAAPAEAPATAAPADAAPTGVESVIAPSADTQPAAPATVPPESTIATPEPAKPDAGSKPA
jgi:sec-independent protein translocase protein TatB